MAVDPKNKHVNALIDNVHEVDRLKKLRPPLKRHASPSDNKDLEVLYKSCIVLLVACWEAYVEDLASAALEYLMAECKDHTALPPYVLDRIASTHSGQKVWELAGDGWKKVLRDNLKSVLAKTTGALNTPKTAQVDELFLKTLGVPKLSSGWNWTGITPDQAARALDDLVMLRGSIAHRVVASRNVERDDVKNARDLVYHLAVCSHNATGEHLKTIVGQVPWNRVKYGT
jgi:hypothetical protein